MPTVTYRIAQGSDDAEERSLGQTVINGSPIFFDPPPFCVGLRWQGIAIPSGSTITYASITLNIQGVSSRSFKLRFQGFADDNVPTFEQAYAGTYNISSRARTVASQEIGSTWTSGPLELTSMEGILQEVIDRPGWAEGNAFGVFVERVVDPSYPDSFLFTSYEGNPSLSAELYVEFDYPPGYVSLPIATGSDDASENTGTGDVDTTATGFQLTASTDLGLRFANLPVPRRAKILSASIAFRQVSATAINSTIYGVAEDDLSTFTTASGSYEISSLPATSASVPWVSASNPATWVNSPDLSAVIQEVVDRANWASGNAIGFRIESAGPSLYMYTRDAGVAYAPILTLQYQPWDPFTQALLDIPDVISVWPMDRAGTQFDLVGNNNMVPSGTPSYNQASTVPSFPDGESVLLTAPNYMQASYDASMSPSTALTVVHSLIFNANATAYCLAKYPDYVSFYGGGGVFALLVNGQVAVQAFVAPLPSVGQPLLVITRTDGTAANSDVFIMGANRTLASADRAFNPTTSAMIFNGVDIGSVVSAGNVYYGPHAIADHWADDDEIAAITDAWANQVLSGMSITNRSQISSIALVEMLTSLNISSRSEVEMAAIREAVSSLDVTMESSVAMSALSESLASLGITVQTAIEAETIRVRLSRLAVQTVSRLAMAPLTYRSASLVISTASRIKVSPVAMLVSSLAITTQSRVSANAKLIQPFIHTSRRAIRAISRRFSAKNKGFGAK